MPQTILAALERWHPLLAKLDPQISQRYADGGNKEIDVICSIQRHLWSAAGSGASIGSRSATPLWFFLECPNGSILAVRAGVGREIQSGVVGCACATAVHKRS